MIEADFLKIEEYLGKPLPPHYREVMRNYPFEDNDSNLTRALYAEVDQILFWNAELLEGEWANEWSAERFAIGCSACGDTYSLDLAGVSPAVFVWDHETHETSIESPDLDSFIAEWKKYEVAAEQLREQNKPAMVRARREAYFAFCLIGASILFILVMLVVALFRKG